MEPYAVEAIQILSRLSDFKEYSVVGFPDWKDEDL